MQSLVSSNPSAENPYQVKQVKMNTEKTTPYQQKKQTLQLNSNYGTPAFLKKGGEVNSTRNNPVFAITPTEGKPRNLQYHKDDTSSPLDRKDLQSAREGEQSDRSHKGIDFHFSQYRMLDM